LQFRNQILVWDIRHERGHSGTETKRGVPFAGVPPPRGIGRSIGSGVRRTSVCPTVIPGDPASIHRLGYKRSERRGIRRGAAGSISIRGQAERSRLKNQNGILICFYYLNL
jgi:hypothetical protein